MMPLLFFMTKLMRQLKIFKVNLESVSRPSVLIKYILLRFFWVLTPDMIQFRVSFSQFHFFIPFPSET